MEYHRVSVMGPVLFLIYVNEISEVVWKNACRLEAHDTQGKLFGQNCKKCGTLTCFADDTTYAVAAKTRAENQGLIDENLENLKVFLNTNSLCINESKTCLVETMNHQKRCKTAGRPPSVTVHNEDGVLIDKEADKSCRLLGANLGQDLTWKSHLITGEKPLIPAIRKQIGILKHLCKNIPVSSRKILAEGLVLSQIKYTIALWGGTTRNMIKKIQVLINKTARCVTGQGRRISTSKLMEQTGRLVSYFTLIETWKNLRMEIPPYMAGKLVMEGNDLVIVDTRLIMTRSSFRWRARTQWNSVSEEMKVCRSLPVFKKQVKKWLKDQRFPAVEDQNPPDMLDRRKSQAATQLILQPAGTMNVATDEQSDFLVQYLNFLRDERNVDVNPDMEDDAEAEEDMESQ